MTFRVREGLDKKPMLVSLCGIYSPVGCALVELDSVQVVPGLIQFGPRTFKSTAFTA